MTTTEERGPVYEAVHHPRHYNLHPSNVECIDLAERLSFNVGTALKYGFRLGHKPGSTPLEDARKCLWYLDRAAKNGDVVAPMGNPEQLFAYETNLRRVLDAEVVPAGSTHSVLALLVSMLLNWRTPSLCSVEIAANLLRVRIARGELG